MRLRNATLAIRISSFNSRWQQETLRPAAWETLWTPSHPANQPNTSTYRIYAAIYLGLFGWIPVFWRFSENIDWFQMSLRLSAKVPAPANVPSIQAIKSDCLGVPSLPIPANLRFSLSWIIFKIIGHWTIQYLCYWRVQISPSAWFRSAPNFLPLLMQFLKPNYQLPLFNVQKVFCDRQNDCHYSQFECNGMIWRPRISKNTIQILAAA